MQIACDHGCHENVLILLQKGCNPNKKTRKKSTVLHLAAHLGHTKIVEHLINYSANINEKDTFGETPLHEAVRAGQVEVCRILLEKGAETNYPFFFFPPWRLACSLGHADVHAFFSSTILQISILKTLEVKHLSRMLSCLSSPLDFFKICWKMV